MQLTKQALGLEPVAPTRLDVKLLSGTTDYLGRTAPMLQYTNGEQARWLSTDAGELTKTGYSNHATAYSVISYILTTAAAVPWGAYTVKSDDTVERLAKHPLADLLYRPNPRHSWADIVLHSLGYLLTCGNAYTIGVRPEMGSRAGKVGEIWPMPPTLQVKGGGWMEEVTGYELDKANGGKETWAPEEILHLKYWNPDGTRYGLSPVAAGIHSLTAAKSGIEARVRQYQNQGPPGVIYDESNTEPWTSEQLSGFRSFLRSFFGNGRRRGEIPVLGGKLGYLNLGLSPVDLDVLAAIPHDKDAVCDLYHFPGQLLNGAKGSTFNNVSEARRALYTTCITPLLSVLRDGLNRWLGEQYGDGVYIDFDLSGIPELQADKKDQVAMLKDAYWITTQEKQRIMGVEVDDSLPKYLFPAGLLTAEQLSAPTEPLA
ncbi:phage portal protein [Hymenobacter psychrophilus]|nr:phage portal protein [Hymenobacter psychrophilus]